MVRVTKGGPGMGTVTGPGAIACGDADACADVFPTRRSVTLNAVPFNDLGTVFTGWSGGVCTGGLFTCTFTTDAAQMVDGEIPVHATFSSGLDIAPASFNFGSVAIGSSAAKVFTVTNLGAASTAGFTVRYSNGSPPDFKIGIDNCAGVTLQTFDTCTIETIYEPTAVTSGFQVALLYSNDTGYGVQDFSSVVGKGV